MTGVPPRHYLPGMSEWTVFEGNVRHFDFRPDGGRLDLVAAGAPGQPTGGVVPPYTDAQ